MKHPKKILTATTFLLLVLFCFIPSVLGFSFDELDEKEIKTNLTIKDINNKITKEFFFDVMASKFSQLVNADKSNYDLIQILSAYFDYNTSHFLAFDEKGKPVRKWHKKYPSSYFTVPNEYAFDMILVNSYNLTYKPNDYYLKSDKNYVNSYYRSNFI